VTVLSKRDMATSHKVQTVTCDEAGAVTHRRVTPLVLSLFPGIDLLGRGFEQEGFCVVRGPDKIWAGDIFDFHPPSGAFGGIIGGPPCQEFSGKRRKPATGIGLELLKQFGRVVLEAQPDWWLMENVDRVPDVAMPGYSVQRFDLNARECGMAQSRRRHFQFGSREGLVLVPERYKATGPVEKIALASEGSSTKRRGWTQFCALQGLPPLDLPGMSIAARYRAVGNGVPIPMARVVARAIAERHVRAADVRLCQCGCGRIVKGKQEMAAPACRKRMERKRKRDSAILPPAG
jgi:DNA (cytosine-5)-methyltransferase 1